MKKLVTVVSLSLIAAILFGLLPFSALAVDNLSGKKILFFGDSITELGGSSRYTTLLQSRFPNSEIINAGKAGNSTYDARLRFQTDVLDKKPDIVFICFGMNDQAIQTNGMPVKTKERYRTNIQNFITALKKIGADVVLMAPHPVCLETETGRTDPNYRMGDLAGYCDILRELAIANGCGLVDMYSEFSLNYNSKTYIRDGLHQTAAGHKVYADKISAYLNAAYNGLNKATLSVKCKTEGGTDIGGYDLTSAIGANLKLPVPVLDGYTPLSSAKTIAASTQTVQYVYSAPWEDAIANAYSINRADYSKAVLAEIDFYIDMCNQSENAEIKKYAAGKLEYLVGVKGDTELIYSTDVAYTTDPAPNYYLWDAAAGAPGTTLTPLYVDDSLRLTDGKKSSTDCTNSGGKYYSVWQGSDVSIIVDLGKKVSVDTFRGYFAGGADGVERPRQMQIMVSEDGISYTAVNAACKISTLSDSSTWDTYLFTVESPLVTARFVKFTVNAQLGWGAKCVWVDEVEVALRDTDLSSQETETPNPDTPSPDEPTTENPSEFKIGDVNRSGALDSMDYVYLKRAYFGTFGFDEEQTKLGDVNKSGTIDSMDYVYLKRAYFGTYVIK